MRHPFQITRITCGASALLALSLLCGCSRVSPGVRVDPALAPLVPAGTLMLAGIRLDKLKDTPFYRTYVEGRKIPQLEAFAERTGLDPRKDLWELVLATNGKVPVVLVRGKFGGMFGQEPRFTGQGLERRNYKGYNLLGSREASVAFMNASVAIAGPPAMIEKIIDSRDSKEQPPQELFDMVAELPGSSHVWAVTSAGGALLPSLPSGGNLANMARVVASLGRASLFANLSDGVDLKATGRYPEAASARQIQDALRGFVGLGRLTTPSNQPEMLRLYDGIRIMSEDTSVIVTVQAPFELFEKLATQLGLRRPG